MPDRRSLPELLSAADEGWQDVVSWVGQSSRTVEVIPPDPARQPECLLALQVSTRSVLGALAWHTGGVVLDHRWLRLLGGVAGSGLPDLATASGIGSATPAPPSHVVVAQDVLGGVFAVNGHGLPCEPGEVAYFAPDTLEWQGMGMGAGAFVCWALTGSTGGFYEQLRWPGWEAESERVPLDSGLHVYPPLFTAEAQRDLASTSRRVVPWHEIAYLQEESARQLSGEAGAPVEGQPPAKRRWRRR